MTIIVKTKAKTVIHGGLGVPCYLGKKGAISSKQGREGDEKTPLGVYKLRFGLYRADRLPRPDLNKNLKNPLNFRPLRPDDGWCDDPNHAAYNRFIRTPFKASHEALWRKDGAYDIILVMDHNDSPPQAPLGSAVFIHIAQPDGRDTMGCIALTPEHMVGLLPFLQNGTKVDIRP